MVTAAAVPTPNARKDLDAHRQPCVRCNGADNRTPRSKVYNHGLVSIYELKTGKVQLLS